MCHLFAVLISLCDSDTKNQVESMTKYPDVKAKRDKMGLLRMIKKLLYRDGTNDLIRSHNNKNALMNLINLQ